MSVRCKWYYIINYRADKTLARYKIRLVGIGSAQAYEAKHLETLVAKTNTTKISLEYTIV